MQQADTVITEEKGTLKIGNFAKNANRTFVSKCVSFKFEASCQVGLGFLN